ncbi:hypothetical protein B0H13DRAFT_1964980 [Mycena leptocephala]|nr:hypothetical protein B0H13DRAFT_1964980 [Mycena leptocephala]
MFLVFLFHLVGQILFLPTISLLHPMFMPFSFCTGCILSSFMIWNQLDCLCTNCESNKCTGEPIQSKLRMKLKDSWLRRLC